MTRHDPRVRLLHMLDHAREAVALADGESPQSLRKNRLLQLGMRKLVEIVGEAAAAAPEEIQESLPTIPWTAAIGMRHRLVHGYDQVDLDVLWRTVREDLPSLIEELEEVLADPRPL